jgi:hypothetical protein
MAPADAVFSYSRLVWLLQMNVLVVVFDAGFNGMASLPNAHVTTFAGYAVYAWSFESEVILHGLKEAGSLPQWEAHRLTAVPGQHPTDAFGGRVDK